MLKKKVTQCQPVVDSRIRVVLQTKHSDLCLCTVKYPRLDFSALSEM